MLNMKMQNKRIASSSLLLFFYVLIGMLNGDYLISTFLLVLCFVFILLKLNYLLKALPIICILAIPAFAAISNKKFLYLDYKVLFYSLVICLGCIIWELEFETNEKK